MTNRMHKHYTGLTVRARHALLAPLLVAAISAAISVNGASAAIDAPDGGLGLLVQPPGGDPEKISAEVDRWGRLLCRARFPLSAKRCKDYKISSLVLEVTVTESMPLTVLAWIDEAKLAEAVGEDPSTGATGFVMPICAKTRIAFPGEVISETKADVRQACQNASAVDDHGLKGDALAMARLRLIREVITTQMAQDDPDTVVDPDPELAGSAPEPVKKLVPFKIRKSEPKPSPTPDLPDFPGDAFVPRSLMHEFE